MQAKGLLNKSPVVRLKAAVAANPAGASVSVVKPKGLETMNIAERIASLESTRAVKANAATAIMEKAAGEGRTLDAQEQTDFDDAMAGNHFVGRRIFRAAAPSEQLQARSAFRQCRALPRLPPDRRLA